MTGWPDETRPGVPLNPERDGWHEIGWRDAPHLTETFVVRWSPDWPRLRTESEPPCPGYLFGGMEGQFLSPRGAARHYRYIGPAFTSAEAQSQLAAARREGAEEMREKAARVCEVQRALWPQWHPDIASHQEPTNRALDYGRRQACEVCAAVIRALPVEKSGDV